MSTVPTYTSDDAGYYYKVPGKAKQGPFNDLRHAMDEYQASLVPAPQPTKKGKKHEEPRPGHIADSLGSAGESQAADGEGAPG